MEMTILSTPFIAIDYLTKGDNSNLTPEQIATADKWNEMFSIENIEEFIENETLSNSIINSSLLEII